MHGGEQGDGPTRVERPVGGSAAFCRRWGRRMHAGKRGTVAPFPPFAISFQVQGRQAYARWGKGAV